MATTSSETAGMRGGNDVGIRELGGGLISASRLAFSLMSTLHDSAQCDLEEMCQKALESVDDKSSISKHEAHRRAKKLEKKVTMSSGLDFSMSSPSAAQLKNHSIRFGIEEPVAGPPLSRMWPFGGSSSSSAPSSSSSSSSSSSTSSTGVGRSSIASTLFGATLSGNDDGADYEEVTDVTILSAPICDICVIQRGQEVPQGYFRLYRTPKNKKANLNAGSGGNQIYLCILKDRSGGATPITAISVIFPDRNEFVPPGFQVVKRDNQPCNVNAGTAAERVYICYKKDKTGNPLVDVQLILPGKGEETPKNFCLVDKSLSGRPANINSGTGGGSILLCYRQGLPRLSCLGNSDQRPPLAHSSSASTAAKSASPSDSRLDKNEQIRRQPLVGSVGSKSTDSMASVGSGGDEKKIEGHGLLPGGGVIRGNRIRTETEESSYLEVSSDSGGLPAPAGGTVAMPPYAPHGPINISQYEPSSMVPLSETPSEAEASGADDDDEDELGEGAGTSVDELMSDKDRRQQLVVDNSVGNVVSEPARLCLWALLSCLYLRQTSVADTVMRGLTSLLKDTDFFDTDLTFPQQAGTLTKLDVAIEAVTDRLDMCRESEFPRVLSFLQALSKHSCGRLSPISLQRIFRALSFMLHVSATRSSWMKEGLPMPLLSDIDQTKDLNAFVVLRDLVWAIVAQVETVSAVHFLPDDNSSNANSQGVVRRNSSKGSMVYNNSSEGGSSGSIASSSSASSATSSSSADAESLNSPQHIVHDFVLNFVEEVMDCVEVSRIAESTQLAVAKQSTSTTSSHFWQSISTMSRRLFTESVHKCAYLTLCVIAKLAWHDVRNLNTGNPLPRDLGVKLMALEALLEFCVSAGEKLRGSKIMGYMIRRLVVPCLLNNIQHGIRDHRIFTKLMKLITALWKVWRSHVRIEFALLVEQIVIRVLQADTLTIRPVFQMIVIQEVVTWFDQPHLLVEMFVNYDMDRKFVSHWNIFSHLIRAVCTTARRVNMADWGAIGDWRHSDGSSDDVFKNPQNAVSIRSVYMQALEEVGRISKTLMDATGHAYLIMQDANFRYKTLGAGAGWEEDEDYGDDNSPNANEQALSWAADGSNTETSRISASASAADASPTESGRPDSGRFSSGATSKKGVHATVKFRRAVHQESEELLSEAIKIYEENGKSLLKAVRYLIGKNFMADTPQEIASFLRLYKESLDQSAIGEFLGEGGKNPAEVEYWSQIRFRYTRAVSFVEMDLEPALRLYLTGCGFRLPGEAQKVDRFVEVFVKAFWQDNSGSVHCPFSHPDTVHVVAYAIIVLNTDHHRANTSKLKAHQKMTKEGFVKMLRGADKDHDIDRDYLCRIFDNVQAEAIELAVEASEGGHGASSAASAAAARNRGSVFGGGPGGAGDAFSAFSLLTFRPTLSSQDLSMQEEQKFFRDITRTLRDSEDLLRSQSPFTYRFQLTGVDTNISMDLVSFMYETVWFHFRAITDSLLDGKKQGAKKRPGAGAEGKDTSSQAQQQQVAQQHNDMYVVFIALDILCYSLTASVFLGLRVEALTFAEQLAKFIKEECSGSGWTPDDDVWLTDVSRGKPESAMETIAKVHTLLVRVKDSVQESNNREVTRAVAARIEKKANVLENNGFFVCEGDLAKRNRNGRLVTYRFFLFSDHLIYAHQGMSGEYKVHGQLHLTQMSVADLPSDTTCSSMYITHPTKSFAVVADNPSVKQQWLRDLQQTILNCNKRNSDAMGRGRKQSFLNRIEQQQKAQIKEVKQALGNSPNRDSVKRGAGASVGAGAAGGEASSPVGSLQSRTESEGDSATPSTPAHDGTFAGESFALQSGSDVSPSPSMEAYLRSPPASPPGPLGDLGPSPAKTESAGLSPV